MATTSTEAAKAAARKGSYKRLRPRGAASLVIVDRSGPEPRILMGRRRLDQAFLPGKVVFPGGRVDDTDRRVLPVGDLDPACVSRLVVDMKGRPSQLKARALALAAIRETYEETGLIIGKPGEVPAAARKLAGWGDFFAHGHRPCLTGLAFFARAITPPDRPRRYDTRFFLADASCIALTTGQIDGELSEIAWLTFEEARRQDMASITRVMIADLADHLAAGDTGRRPVPFYNFRFGEFRRDLILAEEGRVARAP